MNQTCTCGATTSPEARFCPMCARPFREEDEVRDIREVVASVEEYPAPQRPRAQEDVPLGFGNLEAIRCAYSGAALAAILSHIPFVNFLCFIWYPAAAFWAVYRFRNRTGVHLNSKPGAKLGWITGVLAFAVFLFLFATVMLFADDEGTMSSAMNQQIEQMSVQPGVKEQMREITQSAVAMGFVLLVYLGVSFLITAGLCSLGGAVAAKVLEKDSRS